MKQRPRGLTVLGIGYAAIGLALPIQIMFLYGHTPLEPIAIAAKLAPLNWLILVLSLVLAWQTLIASRGIALLLPLYLAIVTYNNWLVSAVGHDFPALSTWAASTVLVVCTVLALPASTRKVIADPKLRWWQTAPRWMVNVPVRFQIFTLPARELQVATFDLSKGGAFIPMKEDLARVEIGAQCFLSFSLAGLSYVQCRAEIVRKAEATGRYPSGVGVRFLGLSWRDQKRLTHFLEDRFNTA